MKLKSPKVFVAAFLAAGFLARGVVSSFALIAERSVMVFVNLSSVALSFDFVATVFGLVCTILTD